MDKPFELVRESIPNQEKAFEFMEKLYDIADPKAVYGEPVEVGEYKVITASEVYIMQGYGYGYGGGAGSGSPDTDTVDEGPDDKSDGQAVGIGGGGGGGGSVSARPVAAIEIGPHGVRVEPIVDPTKIAIAFFTTLISIFAMSSRLKKGLK
ncbi:MAG: hypothetical protein ACK2T3_12570 [Candidatus Promineifilaceae bacterium]